MSICFFSPRRATSVLACLAMIMATAHPADEDGNRLTYLDGNDPFYPHLGLARFTTPQWIGEEGVEAAIIISIDDLREPAKYEAYLRPILERLKQIDGRAPVSVFCNQLTPADSQFQTWLKEGLSLEVHTLTHPCPLLGTGGFDAAARTYHDGVDLLANIPGNRPVAFRMPCCDSMNSASPRFFAEIFLKTSAGGRHLAIDSSVMCLLTPRDKALPRELVTDADGRERFRKYFPTELKPPTKVTFERFAGYIEDYPYPYVIGGACWEFPCAVPSDWEAFNTHGPKNPKTLEDWKAALDAIVIKQGVMTMVLHPHGWSDPQQIVELIDYAAAKHGKRVKFLNFREALERLEKNALGSETLRNASGGDNRVRLIDLDGDSFMDVVVGNDRQQITRLWNAGKFRWQEMPTPFKISDVRFGARGKQTIALDTRGLNAWRFEDAQWKPTSSLSTGFPRTDERTVIQLRDVDNNGECELLVSKGKSSNIFQWSTQASRWDLASFSLPEGASLLNAQGEDNGVRFVDLNGDGFDDLFFSNEERFGIWLWTKTVRPDLGWTPGWSHLVRSGERKFVANEPPPFVRAGPHRNNGAWFKDGHLVVQNEYTAKLEGVVDRRSFKELIAFDIPPPKSPEESRAAIQVRPGFKVELIAAEPLVIDPVAFEWDARGRLWVVEMRDYPLGLDGKGQPGGVIKILEDTDQDGRFDQAIPFLESLPFPTGVMPWRNGALIAAAPDVFYAEDTNADGRADLRRVLFTGFTEGNQQHRFNGFEYGLDNWIYCANGDSGGTVKSIATGKTVKISGRDFRFRPDRGEMQAIEGQTQYGRRCDDWGNWFGNNNPTWLWHYPIPEHYIVRNSQLAVKSLQRMLANYPEPTRVFPISIPPIRFNQPQSLNHVTSACSPAPYRDELFGPEFAASVFISEPVHNAIRCEMLTRHGVSFTSRRADEEAKREFLASSDNWFRPTMLKTGPDGALYIADMYRFVLEHPEWIAPEAQARLDLRAGDDKGRIYRVLPETSARRPTPNLAAMDAAALVNALDSPNGWQRTTAQRLLVERRDQNAVPLLNTLLAKSTYAKARLHALCTLDGLGALSPETLLAGLRDAHPDVRVHAVRLCELQLDTAPALLEAFESLADDPELRVRYQLAYSLGASRAARAGRILVRIALRDSGDPDVRLAVLSSAPAHTAALTGEAGDERLREMLSGLFALSANGSNGISAARVLPALAGKPDHAPEAWQLSAAASFLDALERRGQTIDQVRRGITADDRIAAEAFAVLVRHARIFAQINSAKQQPELARGAIGLLAREERERSTDLELLKKLLAAPLAAEVHSAAMTAMSRSGGDSVAAVVLADWRNYPPALRQEILNMLLTRPRWAEVLLTAIGREVAPAEVGSAQRQTLRTHSDPRLRELAAKVFPANTGNRQAVLDEYLKALNSRGDAAKGQDVFRAQCSICHRFKGEGSELGPDLGMVSGKPVDELLRAILDPNQAIEPRYLAYAALMKDGRTLTGLVTAETANSFTIKAPGGAEQTVLRSELKELTAAGHSLMPEGLEEAIPPEQMADLLQFLRVP